jgi:hypothetical protein
MLIKDQIITNQSIHFGQKDNTEFQSVIGTTFENSEIICQGKGYSGFSIKLSAFRNCRIVGRKANGYFLTSASFTDCKFSGQFTGCVFGVYDGQNCEIKNCDFSESILNTVEFRGALDYSSCVWPDWPTVVFRFTRLGKKELAKLPLPPSLLVYMSIINDEDIDYLAFDLSKCDFDPQEVLGIVIDSQDVLISKRSKLVLPTQTEIQAAKDKFTEQERLRSLYEWWGHMTQQVSITGINVAKDWIDISISKGASSAIESPSEFIVRLTGNPSVKLVTKDSADKITSYSKRFRIMGSNNVDEYRSVELKGHRKELGILRLTYQHAAYLDLNGNEIPKPCW